MEKLAWTVLAFGTLLLASFGCGQPANEAGKGSIRIGGTLSLTGRFPVDGTHMHHGYQLWAKHINAKGGLLGRPVELLIYDDQSDPQTSANLYQQLINRDKMDLVVGPYSSPIAIVASTVTEKLRYPMIPYAAADEIWSRGYKYVFEILQPGMHQLDGALALAKQQGFKRIALINENTVWARTVALGIIETVPKMGLQLVFHEEYPKGTKDFRPLLARVKDRKAEVLLTGGYLEEDILIVRQLKQTAFVPKLYTSSFGAGFDDFGEALGQDAEYMLSTSEWEPQPSLGLPGMQRFIEDFQKEFGRMPNPTAAGGYGMGQVLEAAVAKAGSLDREKIRDALAVLDLVTVYGRQEVNG